MELSKNDLSERYWGEHPKIYVMIITLCIMANVSPIDGIKYGFNLLAYFIAVLGAGAVVSLIGWALRDTSSILGGLVLLVGLLILFAGQAGVLYKVIADGVETGMLSAKDSTPNDPSTQIRQSPEPSETTSESDLQ
jgi:hypothetical protein